MQRILQMYDWCISPEKMGVSKEMLPDFNKSRAPFVLAAESLYGDNLPKEWKAMADKLRGQADDATIEEVKAQLRVLQ